MAKKSPSTPTGRTLPKADPIVTGSGDATGVIGAQGSRTVGGTMNAGETMPLPYGNFIAMDPLSEQGTSGLRRARGIVLEETMRELRGRLGVRALREIYDQSTVANGAILLYRLILRQVKYDVEPRIPEGSKAPDAECEKWAEYCKGVLDDMDHRFDDLMSEAHTDMIYGWALLEETYKWRLGPEPGFELGDDGKPLRDSLGNPIIIPSSKFSDGKLGLRRVALRAQETLQEWKFDENGGILGMLQNDPWGGRSGMRYIPAEKFLLFRTESIKNNPEGRSMLRAIWPTWRGVKRLMEAELVGATRDITGQVMITLPPEAMRPGAKAADAAVLASAERIGTALAMHEFGAIFKPAVYSKDGKNELFKVELIGTSGRRVWDTTGIINRLEARMLTSILMQFMLLGQDKVGSWALSDDQSSAMVMCTNAIADSKADVFTDVAFPRLVRLNGGDTRKAPIMKPQKVQKMPALNEIGVFLRGLGTMGVGLIAPGSEQERFLLSLIPGFPADNMPDVSTNPPPPRGAKPGTPGAPEPGAPAIPGAPAAPAAAPKAGTEGAKKPGEAPEPGDAQRDDQRAQPPKKPAPKE